MEIEFKHLAIPKKVKVPWKGSHSPAFLRKRNSFPSIQINLPDLSGWFQLSSLTFDSPPGFPVMLTLPFEAQITPVQCSGEAPNKCGSLSPRGEICSEVFYPVLWKFCRLCMFMLLCTFTWFSFDQAVIHGPWFKPTLIIYNMVYIIRVLTQQCIFRSFNWSQHLVSWGKASPRVLRLF